MFSKTFYLKPIYVCVFAIKWAFCLMTSIKFCIKLPLLKQSAKFAYKLTQKYKSELRFLGLKRGEKNIKLADVR